jgi:hypothetical protein
MKRLASVLVLLLASSFVACSSVKPAAAPAPVPAPAVTPAPAPVSPSTIGAPGPGSPFNKV